LIGRRAGRLRRTLLSTVVVAGFLWAGGFLHFVAGLPRAVADPDRVTDGIVVLTGTSDRLYAGLDLVRAGKGKRVLITGVDRANDRAALRRALKRGLAEFDCCADLGWEARDTAGNAREAADWAAKNGYRSLRVVTARDHMPRSLLEMRRVMPDIELVAHPVFSNGPRTTTWKGRAIRASRLVGEFNKYLVSLFRARLTRRDGRWAS